MSLQRVKSDHNFEESDLHIYHKNSVEISARWIKKRREQQYLRPSQECMWSNYNCLKRENLYMNGEAGISNAVPLHSLGENNTRNLPETENNRLLQSTSQEI